MKLLFTTFGVLIGAMLWVPTTFAQETAMQTHQGHDHAGHDHSHGAQHPQSLPDIDFILTEAPEDHVIGADNAPVTIISYASVMCPHCASWFTNEWPKLKAERIDTGQVRFVFREFPTSPVDYARAGFVIANCAPADQYFDNIVYQMQSQRFIVSAIQAGQARSLYDQLGQTAGLMTPEDMQACFDDPNAYERMTRAQLRAMHAGIRSVPGFIIQGEVFTGNPSYDGLVQAIAPYIEAGITPLPDGALPDAGGISPERKVPVPNMSTPAPDAE